MLAFLVCSTLLATPIACLKNDPSFLKGTELVMSFMVHRHGARTPVTANIQYVTDKGAVEPYIEKYGYGQLTHAGTRVAYNLGNFIRGRYDDYLSDQYNSTEIYIRSTDSTRTKMTILAALAAIYPPTESWCDESEFCVGDVWTPVPYTTISAIYDYNVPFFNCPTLIKTLTARFKTDYPQMKKYKSVLEEWSEIININFTAYPVFSYVLHDAYVSQIYLGVPLGKRLHAIFPKIQKVAGAGLDAWMDDLESLRLSAGVMLNEFFDITDKIVSGETLPTFRVYSAHDFNVFSFMRVTNATPRQGVPKYGSMYGLEVRIVKKTGQFVVVPVYQSKPSAEEVIYLQVEGCGELCDLDKFRDLVSGYRMNEKEWRKKCDWSEDYAFNFDNIN